MSVAKAEHEETDKEEEAVDLSLDPTNDAGIEKAAEDSASPTNEEVVAAIEKAEDKIDDYLRTRPFSASRRVYFGGPGGSAGNANRTSWAMIGCFEFDEKGTEDDAKTLERIQDDGDESERHASNDSEHVYGDFLKSQANLQALNVGDIEKAEELFYTDFPKEAAVPSATVAISESPRYTIQKFKRDLYDDKEHTWSKKPFSVVHMPTFFGTIREDKMDKLIISQRRKIAESGCWDREGLVLSDIGKPFRCKLCFSVKDEKNRPRSFKIEHLSGLWYSKVYSGDGEKFAEWVMDAVKVVQSKYATKVNTHRDFYAYYPSNCEKSSSHETVVVFFIKITKLKK